MPRYYVGSSSVKSVEGGYRGSVASRKYKALWKQELTNNPTLFVTAIISTHRTREDALDAEFDWQLEHSVVESADFINMSYARSKFYGLTTPDLIAAFKEAIANRTPEERAKIRATCQERQRKFLASRSPEKVIETAEKQARSLAKYHAQRSANDKIITAERKRKTLSLHDQEWHEEVNARRAATQRATWAKRKGVK